MSLGLQDCLGQEVRELKQTSDLSFFSSRTLWWTWWSTGVYPKSCSHYEQAVCKAVFNWEKVHPCFKWERGRTRLVQVVMSPSSMLSACSCTEQSSAMLDSSGWTLVCVPVTELLLNNYYNLKAKSLFEKCDIRDSLHNGAHKTDISVPLQNMWLSTMVPC